MPRPRAVGELTIAVGVLLLATLAMFGDVLVAGSARILSKDGEDLATIFLNWQEFGFAELRRGHLPLWNPHIYSGSPYFAGFQPALLYPPNWIGVMLSSAPAINVGVTMHVLLAGLWVYLWARHRDLHPVACLMAALVFMFCGAHFLQIYRGHLPNLRTLVWAPLVLLSIDGWIDTGRPRWALVGMAAVGMQILAGHVQEMYYTGLVAGGYAFSLGLARRQIVRALAGFVVIYIGGASLSAVQLLAGIDAARETARSDLTYEIASMYSFPPENVLTLILPGIFGDLVTTPYWGRWTLTEMCLFIGVAPFLLALYGARHGAPEKRRSSLVFAVLVLILAFGYYTPLYNVFYTYLPGFGSFRGTTKFAFLATLFIIMLSAVGLDAALRTAVLPRWPGVLAATAGALLFVTGAAVWQSAVAGAGGGWARLLAAKNLSDAAFYEPIDWAQPFFTRAGQHAALVLAIGGASFFAAGAIWNLGRRRRRALYALALLGVVEVFVYARYSRPTFDPAPRFRASDQLRRFLAHDPDDHRILALNPYLAMTAGAHDVYGYDPMLLTRYADLLATTQGVDRRRLIVTRIRHPGPLLGMLRLRWVVEMTDLGVHASFADLRQLPRAFLVTHWRVVTDDAARLAVLKDRAFDARSTVLLETPPDPPPNPEAEPATLGPVRVIDISTDAVDIEAEVTSPAVLILSDSYSAGWKATALSPGPQEAYRVLPADHTLLAIPLAAGHHHLRLEYRPLAFVVGTWITIAALFAYAVAIVFIWRKPHLPAHAPRA